MRLLIIEDEKDIAIPLAHALAKKGYAVDWCSDGKTGLQHSMQHVYDCVILDLHLPEQDGISVAKSVREQQNTVPILMLTVRSTQKEIIQGFHAGADDYMTKPFNFTELLCRINVLIKRSSQNKDEVLTVQDIVFDPITKKVMKKGRRIVLNNKELGILEYLLRNKGRSISQEEFLEHVWNKDIDAFSQTVRTNIKTLRQKIDPEKSIIHTNKGRGYVIHE